jgi:hypothetical protein
MTDIFKELLLNLRVWWKQARCDHDYVIEHYGNRCAIERCTKCGSVNQLGR